MHCVHTQSLSCVGLFCNPMEPASSVHGIIEARILGWVAICSSRGSSQPRDQTHVPCIGRWILSPLSHLGSPIGTLEDWNFRHPRKASLSWWHNLKYLKEMREPTVWIYGARIFLTEETSVQNLWNTSISWFKWNFHEHLQKC